MAISSMMLVGCSAALVPAPASCPRRPPLGILLKSCLKATLAALLAGMLRPRALDKIEVIAAWIWVLKRLKRRAPTILRNMAMMGLEKKLPVLCNWHGPHSQLAILDPEQCFGHLTRILGRILLLHITDGAPASAHHGLHHLHVLVHGGHVGHARAVHHPLHHRAHRFS